MCCNIASNDNRIYAALESAYGTVAAVSAQNRIPAVKLGIRHAVEQPRRRDKTGGRTYPGSPAGFRARTSFDLTTYMSEWDSAEPQPCYGPLFQSALGGAGLLFSGRTVAAVADPTHISFTAAHGLVPGQAVRFGGEIRFAAAIESPTAIVLNAPFATAPSAGAAFGRAVTYFPATELPTASVFDYWSPADTVQRILAGSAMDRMRIQVNGDFHQFSFAGEASRLIDNLTFTGEVAGLTEFPDEPAVAPSANFSLVPGSMGEAWFGADAAQFHTVMAAEVLLENNIDLRRREFGMQDPVCLTAGQRRVTLDLELVADCKSETKDLYQAAAQRSPIGVMFQLGQTAGHLCGVWMSQVIPEVPEFDDGETRLKWRFRDSRAQGAGNDEIVVAFA